MSLRSELDSMQKQRARQESVRKALQKMDDDEAGQAPDVTAEKSKEKSKEKSTEKGSEESSLVLPAYDPLTSPARQVDASPPGKPWLRGGKQWRRQTTRERQQEQDEIMDKKALDQLQAYRVLQQTSQDEFELEAAATAKRNQYEARTGKRKLPAPRARGTYIGPAEPTPPATNLWDNKRHSGNFGSE